MLPVVARSFTFVISGVAAGFVANELKKRLMISMQVLSERNKIVNMFGQYISLSVVEKLLNQKAEFMNEMRHIAIMFF